MRRMAGTQRLRLKVYADVDIDRVRPMPCTRTGTLPSQLQLLPGWHKSQQWLLCTSDPEEQSGGFTGC